MIYFVISGKVCEQVFANSPSEAASMGIERVCLNHGEDNLGKMTRISFQPFRVDRDSDSFVSTDQILETVRSSLFAVSA